MISEPKRGFSMRAPGEPRILTVAEVKEALRLYLKYEGKNWAAPIDVAVNFILALADPSSHDDLIELFHSFPVEVKNAALSEIDRLWNNACYVHYLSFDTRNWDEQCRDATERRPIYRSAFERLREHGV